MAKKRKRSPLKRILLGLIPYLLILILVIVLLVLLLNTSTNVITYRQFLDVLSTDNNTSLQEANVTLSNSDIIITGRYSVNGAAAWVSFSTVIPSSDAILTNLFGSANIAERNTTGLLVGLTDARVTINNSNGTSILSWLPSIISAVLIIAVGGLIFYSLSRRGGVGDTGISKSKAKKIVTDIKFKDVAGYKEEKEELREIVDFLRNPKRYVDMGARAPRGVLLSGPPGTGKTLLAKAVSGEAEVAFFFVTGSEFDDMFVGVGANRVKDLFAQAKKSAPAIIFIDEIDALGAKRSNGFGLSGRDQTINQFLAELDGFETSDNIIVIGSTNKPESLDTALLRSGRFDRKIVVPPPDLLTREKILRLHAEKKKIAPAVDLDDFAKRMPGFTGADIENVLNESALLAVRRRKSFISSEEIEEAIDRVIAGPSRKSKVYDQVEKEVIAIHEAGHAVVGIELANASDVEKITLVPRGMAGGYTLTNPINERIIQTKEDLEELLAGLLGGRAAVEIIYGSTKITSGAQNDIERATRIAMQMVTQLGMSKLGTIQYGSSGGYQFLGGDTQKNFSDATSREIDLEVRKIIKESYFIAAKTILNRYDLLRNLTRALIKVETIVKNDIKHINSTGELPPEIKAIDKDIEKQLEAKFNQIGKNLDKLLDSLKKKYDMGK